MQDVFFDEVSEGAAPSGLRRALMTYIRWGGAALSLLVVGLLVLWAWRLGTRDATEIPVIRAAETPARVAPEDPGGTEMAHQGLEVNEILGGGTATPPEEVALAPEAHGLTAADDPPEGEAVVPFAALEGEDGGSGTLEAGPPADETAAADDGSEDPGTAQAEEILALIAEEARGRDGSDEAAGENGETPLAAIPRPRVRPEDLSSASATAAPAPSGAPADPAGLARGTLLVQLGAFDSEAQAQTQWVRLLDAHGDLLGGRQHYVQRAESNGRTFWRLRVAGFDGRNGQRALCDALRARGADCIGVTVR